MQEYKRDKVSLEAKLKESAKATAYHGDHLRVIDAWYNQVSRGVLFNCYIFYINLTNLAAD
jgi:hypothetical protein